MSGDENAAAPAADPVAELLRELGRLKRDNERLRNRVHHLSHERDSWRSRANTGAVLHRSDPRHGTENAYSNLNCRCGRCCKAHAAAMREYTHRTGRRKPRAEYLAERRSAPPPPHGTESRYTNRGCRCEDCKRASAEARAKRRSAQLAGASELTTRSTPT